MTIMAITEMHVRVKVGLRLPVPHEAEMILTSYRRETGQFQPEWLELSWSQGLDGEAFWLSATVHGHRTIKRGARAQVEYSEDNEGEIWHWPDYVREALQLARNQVKS